MCVNGRTWPFLAVEPRRYRFRVVNACNARFVRKGLVDASSGATGPALYQIGTDGGLLDPPVKLPGLPEPVNNDDPSPTTRLFLAPSERALGGNPAFSPFLSVPVIPPDPSEAGRKDVAKVFPGVRQPVHHPLGAAGNTGRRRPPRAEPVLLRPHQGTGLPGALPHPRP